MALEIYNSITNQIEIEEVCAEGFLRFLYSNAAGNLLLWALIKRGLFSKFFGLWADSKISRKAALDFIEKHNIRVGEMKLSPSDFKCFNDFFTRELVDEARPLSAGENDISFPADARHLAFENVTQADTFYAKGQRFDLEKFLDSADLAKRFDNASMMISRLSPLDYHRFHFPVSGRITARKLINGALYSVSPIALSKRIAYMFENKRELNIIELDNGGLCAIVEIGATNVGGIKQLQDVGAYAKRGDCKGYFKFGGSCVVTIFEKNLAKFDSEILQHSQTPIEYYAKVNSRVGELNL